MSELKSSTRCGQRKACHAAVSPTGEKKDRRGFAEGHRVQFVGRGRAFEFAAWVPIAAQSGRCSRFSDHEIRKGQTKSEQKRKKRGANIITACGLNPKAA